jgi:RimJ/RimL family protein N-acetyltransferase
MDPIDLNAGRVYLRPLSAGGRFDDRAAVLAGFADAEMRHWTPGYRVPDLDAAGAYIADRAARWERGTRLSWAVAEPVTGELLAEVDLKDLAPVTRSAAIACWTLPGHRRTGVLRAALPAVLRFGFGALDLHRIEYRQAEGNVASARLAAACGFVYEGRLRDADMIEGVPTDLHVWSRLATDPPAAGR